MIEHTVASWKNQGKRIVFTNGCFDIIHAGHIQLLNFAKDFGDILIVGLNSDGSVRKLKGPGRPIMDLQSRYDVLMALKPVNYVEIFEEETPEELIRSITPDFLIKGEDYRDKEVAGRHHVENSGGRLVLFPFNVKQSTTKLIDKINTMEV